MDRRKTLGNWGEAEACRYLEAHGYAILDRNVRASWGELDIVARAPDRTLVFVEVKTLRTFPPDGLEPEDHMNAGKLKRFQRAASLYAGARGSLVELDRGWRLDVIAIAVRPRPTEATPGFFARLFKNRGAQTHDVRHYENVGRED